ncbi:hypothetical protein [Ornithinimicrobium murale]|uniref:hypothetical protein n=1 Tax=Ornithinimicrobium murale TaxID=1050153 RepID=UPI000E0D914F|nr:hypothetical protein [Ornithinimicrobium murale]
MHDIYNLIGSYGAAKAVLTQPLGAIGLVRYDGTVRTVFLRAHDSVGQTAAGEFVVSPSAYLAELGSHSSVEDLVNDSGVTFDSRHGDILAWQIAPEGLKPLCRHDEDLTDAIASVPAGCGFLIGDYASTYSAFTLGFRGNDGTLSSGCGPAITAEAFSDTEDMSDVPDDPRAEVQAVDVLTVARDDRARHTTSA